MSIKNVALSGNWSFKLSVFFLSSYFLFYIPVRQIFFPGHPLLWKYGHIGIWGIFLAFILLYLKSAWRQLGFATDHIRQHCLLGVGMGILPLLFLPALDALVAVSGMGNSELFAGAQNIPPVQISLFENMILIFPAPIITQVLLSGVIGQSLLKKYNPVLAIYLGGILFTLVHLKLSLGFFILGFVTVWLFQWTGTLYAPILFHIGCAATESALLQKYPRLIPLLGFFFEK